jgi:hypothetical protein
MKQLVLHKVNDRRKLMKRTNWVTLVLILAVLLLSSCGQAKPQASGSGQKPSTVEKIEGSEFSRVTLTQKAAERLDIQAAPVRLEQIDGNEYKVMPYAAVLYGPKGETWSYTNPEPLVYIRQSISIDHIAGDLAVLSVGPEVGMKVVIVGASMLYGAEVGVSK